MYDIIIAEMAGYRPPFTITENLKSATTTRHSVIAADI